MVAMARDCTDKAIAVLVAALDDPQVKIRVQAAELLLARAWGRPGAAIDPAEQRMLELRSELYEHQCASEGRKLISAKDRDDKLAAIFGKSLL